MRFLTGLLAGMLLALAAQGAVFAGQVFAAPQTTIEPPGELHREIAFKVLAPKGYQDMGYVAFKCTPDFRTTHIKNGLKRNDPWKKKPVLVAAEVKP